MKKVKWCVDWIVIVLFLSSCSVSFSHPKPTEGIWYCEELKMSIDFSKARETDLCAKLYKDNGSVETMHCCFDYGRGIYIYEETENGEHIDYLNATYTWSGDEFVVTTIHEQKTYIFQKKQ